MHTTRAAVVIEKDGDFLLVQEASPRVYGLWNWIQGSVEQGEGVEDAAVREAKEETGYDIKLVRKVEVIENPFPDTKEIHVFLGEISGGELKINEDEILQTRWFSKEELIQIKAKTPGPWVYETISNIVH